MNGEGAAILQELAYLRAVTYAEAAAILGLAVAVLSHLGSWL